MNETLMGRTVVPQQRNESHCGKREAVVQQAADKRPGSIFYAEVVVRVDPGHHRLPWRQLPVVSDYDALFCSSHAAGSLGSCDLRSLVKEHNVEER